MRRNGALRRAEEALAQERAAQAGKPAKARPRVEKDADTVVLEKRLSDVLGLSVKIEHRGQGGELRIKYKNLEQLDGVIRRLTKIALAARPSAAEAQPVPPAVSSAKAVAAAAEAFSERRRASGLAA